MFIVYAKAGVSVALALALLIVFGQRRPLEALFASERPWLFIFWLLLRLVPFLAVYVLLDYRPQSDVSEYYYPIGRAAATGKTIYRDVYCPYSPLFGYYLALPLRLWNDSRVIVLAMTAFEWLAVWLTYRHVPTNEDRGRRLFRCLVYYLLPVPFVFCILSGQEDVTLWIFALLAGRAIANGQSYRAGLWFALGLLSTKAIMVLMVVPLFFSAKNKVRFLAGCVTLGLPVLIYLYGQTGDLFLKQPLEEGKLLKAPNLRSVLAPFIGEGINRTVAYENYAGLLLTLLASFGLVRTARPTDMRRYVALIYLFIFSLMTVVQHNAISNYAYLFMLPFVFVMPSPASVRPWLALLAFNVLAAVHPSFWWRIGMPFFYGFDQLSRPVDWLDYGIEVTLVTGFAYIVYWSGRQLRAIVSARSLAPARAPGV